MNENLNLPQKLTCDVTQPAGQKVKWTGKNTSRVGESLLERGRTYHPLAFNVTKHQVFIKLQELPHAWFDAVSFDEVFDGRN